MADTLPGNPHAAEANSPHATRDAYLNAQATLALAHEVRTLTLAIMAGLEAAHGGEAPAALAARLGA
jgi:hypothetical protein